MNFESKYQLRFLFLLLIITSFSSCNTSEEQEIPQKTISESICEIPALSIFCSIIQQTEDFNYRYPANTNRRVECDNATTIFAFDNNAIQTFLDNFPQWNTIADVPNDTLKMIIDHHTFEGAMLWIDLPNPVQDCDELINYGSIGYQMKDGGQWMFASNGSDEIAIITSNTQFGVTLDSPIINNEYALIYKIDNVFRPF